MVGTLAAANQALLLSCPFPRKALAQCADAAAEGGDPVLVQLLTADAEALTATGARLSSLPLPQIDRQTALHLAVLREDLALCSEGLSSLLWEIIAGLRLDTVGGYPRPVSA
jgi:hypothetical protein